MRILLVLVALVCLVSGCVLWLIGFQAAGVALTISSTALALFLSFARQSEEEGHHDKLQTKLDWGLVATGLIAFALTWDTFFLGSAVLIAITSDGIMERVKKLTAR